MTAQDYWQRVLPALSAANQRAIADAVGWASVQARLAAEGEPATFDTATLITPRFITVSEQEFPSLVPGQHLGRPIYLAPTPEISGSLVIEVRSDAGLYRYWVVSATADGGLAFVPLDEDGSPIAGGQAHFALQPTELTWGDSSGNVYTLAPFDGGTGAPISSGILTTEGDLLYHDGTGLARLAVGADNDVLTVNGTTVNWEAGGGGGPHTHSHDTELTDVSADDHHAQAHSISGADHTGTLNHSALGSVGANDHHAQNHNLVDTTGHPASGLTAGHVIRASAATSYGFAQLGHGDLGSVTADQHHAQAHAIGGADHSGTLDHGALGGLTDDDHTQYLKETDIAAKGDLYVGTANDTVGILTVGSQYQTLYAESSEATGLLWREPRYFVPISGALVETGAPVYALVGTAGGTRRRPAWAFDGAADERIVVPDINFAFNFDAGAPTALTIRFRWARASGTAAANVRWQLGVTYFDYNAGDTVDAVDDYAVASDSAAGATAQGIRVTLFNPSTLPGVTDDGMKLNIARIASHANDTLNGVDAWLLGVEYFFA